MATAEKHLNEMAKTAGVESVAQLFKKRVAEDGARTAARYKSGGKWTDMSWSQLAAQAEEVAFGLAALGIKKGEMVSILAGTRIEWTAADMGIALAGGIAVPIDQSARGVTNAKKPAACGKNTSSFGNWSMAPLSTSDIAAIVASNGFPSTLIIV